MDDSCNMLTLSNNTPSFHTHSVMKALVSTADQCLNETPINLVEQTDSIATALLYQLVKQCSVNCTEYGIILINTYFVNGYICYTYLITSGTALYGG